MLKNMEEILAQHVSGFHVFSLKPRRVSYASEDLCRMLGCEPGDLVSETSDLYEAFVHPADRRVYLAMLEKLQELQLPDGEKPPLPGESEPKQWRPPVQEAEYRLVRRDGSVIYVRDHISMQAMVEANGSRLAFSVLTDITALKAENCDLQFLNDTIPCGFLRFTCEMPPRVTYINERMLKILRFPEGREDEQEELELYRNNIFLMIPQQERRRFADFLERVEMTDGPIAGEITVQRCDGTKARLFGWVTKNADAQGRTEFQSVCMDITEKHKAKTQSEAEHYLKALSDVYDKVFQFDLSSRTVKCLYMNQTEVSRWLQYVPIEMEEAAEQWIHSAVVEQEKEAVRAFFAAFYQRKFQDGSGEPRQIRYHALSSDGTIRAYAGIFLTIDGDVSLFCCRRVQEEVETQLLRSENLALKSRTENMQQFTDGLAAFEVVGERVTPLYASDNVCRFFGISKDEWLQLMQHGTTIRQFVSCSAAAYEDFLDLLENGEAEFTYVDLQTQSPRRIKAICSQKSSQGASPRYVMLYKMEDGGVSETDGGANEGRPRVYVRTFGYFDVFVDGKPIAFRYSKSKELLALLVDRRGGYVSSEEAISFLWEDEPVSTVTLARYRKVALRLKNILEEYGIVEIVEAVDGKRRLVAEKVQCDLYDYLTQKEEYAQLFKGSYLTNYSWGENTLGELLNQ